MTRISAYSGKKARGPIPVMRTPRSVDLEITSRCNLRCRYCYFFDNPSVSYTDLPSEEWLRFFDELGRLAVMNVCLIGGEPFIREDLPLLIEGLVRNRMRFSIVSNGGLIEDETASFIAGTSRCDGVQVSVDGSGEKTHDILRGKGSFDGALRGIRILLARGIRVDARMTIHRWNIDDLECAVRLLLDDLGLPEISTNAAGYLGSCRQNSSDILLTATGRQSAMKRLMSLADRYPGRITATAGPLAEASYWWKMEKARMEGAPGFPLGGRLTGCGCSSEKITVRADGTIIPCTMLAHVELGSINKDSLKEVWMHSPALNGLRERGRIPLTAFEFCSGCEYIPYCTGNCPGLAYAHTGRIDHPAPDACLRDFLAEGGSLMEPGRQQNES